jgi:hypothetical protein
MDDPTDNFLFGVRLWDEQPRFVGPFWRDDGKPEKPPPKQQRLAPRSVESQPSQTPLSNKQSPKNSRSTTAAPRRKRRQAPSFKLIRIGRKLLDPRGRS